MSAVECTFTAKALMYVCVCVTCTSSPSPHIRHSTNVPIWHGAKVCRRQTVRRAHTSHRRFRQTTRNRGEKLAISQIRAIGARTRRTGDSVGARKFRLKRSCAGKHFSLRRRRRGSGPRGNVLVERRSGIKHISHISHLRCVPTPNVLVERWSVLKQ